MKPGKIKWMRSPVYSSDSRNVSIDTLTKWLIFYLFVVFASHMLFRYKLANLKQNKKLHKIKENYARKAYYYGEVFIFVDFGALSIPTILFRFIFLQLVFCAFFIAPLSSFLRKYLIYDFVDILCCQLHSTCSLCILP